MRTKKEYQQLAYLYDNQPLQLSSIITESEFTLIMTGDAANNWDEDYWCMIEQLVGESLE